MILTLCCLNVMACNYDKMLHLEGETFDMKIGQNCKFELCCVCPLSVCSVLLLSRCVSSKTAFYLHLLDLYYVRVFCVLWIGKKMFIKM